jgi:PAS domain S-box-containing protein
MKTKLENWFSLAMYDNEEDRRVARVSLGFVLFALLTGVSLIIMGWFWGKHTYTLIIIVGCGLQIFILAFLFRGNLSAASYALVLINISLITISATAGRGMHDHSIMAYLLIVVYAGMAEKQRGLIVSTSLIILSLVWLTFGKVAGWFTTRPFLPTSWLDLIVTITIVLFIAFEVNLLIGNLKDKLAQLRHELAERKRVETVLIQREEFIRNINNNLVSGMVYQVFRMKDGSRKFTYLSEAVQRLYGVTPQAGIEDPSLIYGRVHPDDAQRVFLEEEEANRTLSVFKTEVRVINPDGSIRWSSYISNPSALDDGITCWDGIELDITERKRAAEAVRQSREMYRLLTENISDVIWILDFESGKFQYVSPSVERLRGYTADEVMQQSMSASLTPESFQAVQANVPAVLQAFKDGQRGFYVDELEQTCKDGSTVWTEAITSFHLNESNGHLEVYGVSRNITKRKQLQEQDRQRIALEERQHLARDLHDAVSQTLFSARVTSEMLLRQKKTISQKTLWKNIAHFAVLVKSALGEMRILLLELRPESLTNTELPILLAHLVDAAASRVEAKIQLEIQGKCESPVDVKIAFYRIAQEALNNIIKHADSKKITLQLICANDLIQLTAEDDGVGLQSAEQSGSQMGLKIMRERAHEIGADLEIVSTLGQGTQVTCTWKANGRSK